MQAANPSDFGPVVSHFRKVQLSKMDTEVLSSTEKKKPCMRQGAARYVLMTAAYNEEAVLEMTIRSVVSQTLLPERWVIVSDGSTDKTNEIVERYAQQYDFIHFLRLARAPGRSFGSKAVALHKASDLLASCSFDFIGNLDADITVEPSYFESLIDQFQRDAQLGIVAGYIYEQDSGEFRVRSANRPDSVPHAAQLVRRSCYESIGGYVALKYGGEDWHAQISAKMRGWNAKAVPLLKVFHHRRTGGATNLLRHRFCLGSLDYCFGSDPVFELFKCAIRVFERPYLIGSFVRFAGFCWGYVRKEERCVSQDLIAFLRAEQQSKLRGRFSVVR